MNENFFNHLIAGTFAGTNEALITWPTENIKTRMQFKNETKPFKTITKEIYKKNGFKGFYQGLSPILLFNIPKVASRFYAFETSKKYLESNKYNKNLITILSGLNAGFIESTLITVPSETLKTKFIKNPTLSSLQIVKNEGVKGLYQGYFPTLFRQSLNQASRFYFFHQYKDFLLKKNVKYKSYHSFFGGVGAGTFSVLVSTPFDVLKTQMQENKNTKMISLTQEIYTQSGIKGFWRGSIARLLRVAPGQGVMFLSYEFVMKTLNL